MIDTKNNFEMPAPFGEILDTLVDSADLPIPIIFRLSDMAPNDLNALKERWPSIEDERRRVITQHMADISETNFEVEFSPLLGFLLSDPSPAVRRAALDGLWDTDNIGLIRPIIALMENDPIVDVRAGAAQALAHFILMGVWGQLSKTVLERVTAALLATYNNEENAAPVRCAALEGLGAALDESVPNLIEAAYDSSDLAYQSSALFAMGSSADARWLSTVIDEMESPYPAIRAIAARAAGEIGDAAAVEPLAYLVGADSDDAQVEAIYAVGKIGGATASKLLDQWLADDDLEAVHEQIEEAIEAAAAIGELDMGLLGLEGGDEEWMN